jgi:hypothetical protein
MANVVVPSRLGDHIDNPRLACTKEIFRILRRGGLRGVKQSSWRFE